MIITKQYLSNLKRISKIFDRGVPIGPFTMVNDSHTSALEVKTKGDGDRRYMLSLLPNGFIAKDNAITILNNGIEINGLILMVEADNSEKNYKMPKITYPEYCHIKTHIDGRVFKALLDCSDAEYVRFVHDEQSTAVEIHTTTDIDVPKLRYRLDKGYDGEKFGTYIDINYLRKYKGLYPSDGLISITFADEYPITLEWTDDMDNEYTLMVAPRVKGDY